jgi:hypothetical protein
VPGARVAPVGLPSSSTYKDAAVAVLRATAGGRAPSGASSPLSWNEVALSLPSSGLAHDVRILRTLNGALEDAAIATWRAKRASEAPRPISMIRYLAFAGQSSDPKGAAYSADGLPLVPGLIEVRDGKVVVREGGRWVAGAAWMPPVATPASPGGVSERAAFAYAAGTVLARLTGRSSAALVDEAAASGLREGIELPADAVAGRAVGVRAAESALAASR